MNTRTVSLIPLASARSAPLVAVEARTPTPVRLVQFGAAILVASALLWVSAHYAARSAGRSLQVLGRDCAPSIVAALRLRTAMTDLDANLLNEFLTQPDSPERIASRRAAQHRRAELSVLLVEAAGNVTLGEAEKKPLIQIVADLAHYEVEMSRALTLEEKGDHAEAEAAARRAQNLISGSLRRSAEALEKTNRDAFEAAYRESETSLQAYRVAAYVGALGCGIALVAAQIFLSQRHRRLLNPGLLVASLALFGLFIGVVDRLGMAGNALREMKVDAFQSISLLWQARVIANEALAAESRCLFDPAHAVGPQRDFDDGLNQLLLRPLQVDWPRVSGQLNAGSIPQGYDGLLIRALRNVTYPGERDALLETIVWLARYAEIDTQMRALQSAGRSEAAVKLCLSTAHDGSAGAFAGFEAALDRALVVNQKAFDRVLDTGLEASASVQRWCLIACPLILLASTFGLWLRWREYRI